MRKYVLLSIALVLALMLGVSGCSAAQRDTLEPSPAPAETAAPQPTADPMAEYSVVGPWSLSASRNDIAALYTVFGTSLRDYGSGMELKSDGGMEYHVGMAGGAGSYVRDGGKITATLTSYNEGKQEQLELQLVQDDSGVYLSCVVYDTTLYWTQDEGDAVAAANNSDGAYDALLELYQSALSQRYDDLALSNAGLNYMLMFNYNGEPLNNMGYCLTDLDGDGSNELLIAQLSGDEFYDKLIYDLYTLVDGAPKQLFSSGERDRYYLLDGNLIYNSGSSGAAESVNRELTLSGGQLAVSRELYYNGASESGIQWTLSYGGEQTGISEAEAQTMIAEMESAIIKPAYTPFSELNK